MNLIEIPLAVLRVQYQIVRFPLQLIEDKVVSRLDSEATGRLLYERSLGVLDSTVGSFLGDSATANRGSALVERSEALGRAARLDAEAESAREQAAVELKAKRDDAVDEQKRVRDNKDREVQAAAKQEQERKTAAAIAARERTVDAKQEAAERAAERTRAAEAVKSVEQAEIRAAEDSAAAAAKAKERDAEKKRTAAATKRVEADHIEKLAEAEKDNRLEKRANKPS